jgi:hypothetical protein
VTLERAAKILNAMRVELRTSVEVPSHGLAASGAADPCSPQVRPILFVGGRTLDSTTRPAGHGRVRNGSSPRRPVRALARSPRDSASKP